MLELITSSEIPFHHAFFTRKGGASSGVFSGLNCGMGSSDQSQIIAINRARVAEAMQVPPQDLIGVYQIHSALVHKITVPEDAHLSPRPEADALVTALPGLALSILTADCQPVLFADPETKVIGAAHAGWRGAFEGVLEATVDAMEELGAKRGNIRAIIGPSIGPDAYEVSQEFHDIFMKASQDNARFFRPGKPGKYYFDLPSYGVMRLQNAGVGHAEWTGHCTYSDPSRFYSYRRTTHLGEADYGRLIASIRI